MRKDVVGGENGSGGDARAPHAWLAAAGMLVLLVAWIVAQASLVQAQALAESPPAGSVVRVANTDGEPLNLRAGPSSDQQVLARLAAGELLTISGVAQASGPTRWLPVQDGNGLNGWVAAEYVVVVSTPTPTPTVVAEASPVPVSEPVALSSPTPLQLSAGSVAALEQPAAGPLQVEAKLKYPEARGDKQEITVWVMRDGLPVPGATVSLTTSSGDDDKPVRVLEPTDDEGKVRRVFGMKQEKGSVEVRVQVVAPDGSEGRTVVTFFHR